MTEELTGDERKVIDFMRANPSVTGATSVGLSMGGDYLFAFRSLVSKGFIDSETMRLTTKAFALVVADDPPPEPQSLPPVTVVMVVDYGQPESYRLTKDQLDRIRRIMNE